VKVECDDDIPLLTLNRRKELLRGLTCNKLSNRKTQQVIILSEKISDNFNFANAVRLSIKWVPSKLGRRMYANLQTAMTSAMAIHILVVGVPCP
jgi:hypothetical protein